MTHSNENGCTSAACDESNCRKKRSWVSEKTIEVGDWGWRIKLMVSSSLQQLRNFALSRITVFITKQKWDAKLTQTCNQIRDALIIICYIIVLDFTQSRAHKMQMFAVIVIWHLLHANCCRFWQVFVTVHALWIFTSTVRWNQQDVKMLHEQLIFIWGWWQPYAVFYLKLRLNVIFGLFWTWLNCSVWSRVAAEQSGCSCWHRSPLKAPIVGMWASELDWNSFRLGFCGLCWINKSDLLGLTSGC